MPATQIISCSLARRIQVASDGSLTVEGASHPDVEVDQLPGGATRWIAVTVRKEATPGLDFVGGVMWRLVDPQGNKLDSGNAHLSDEQRHVVILPDCSALEYWNFEVALRFRTEGLHRLELDLAVAPGGVRMQGVDSPMARFAFPLAVRVVLLPS